MPAKKQVTKEKIIEAAINIIRDKGYGAVNARNIAKELNCSTQPIYLSFSGMEELKTSIAQEAFRIYQNFVSSDMKKGIYPPYKAYGMAYIHFAKEEKELFKFLFMCDRSNEKDRKFEEMLHLLTDNNGLDYDTAYKIHMEMWFFGHGIATMLATSYIKLDEATISDYISDAYKGIRLSHGAINEAEQATTSGKSN